MQGKERPTGTLRFIRQETFERRDKSSCIPTSIVNAAISLGVVNPGLAETLHRLLLDHLVAFSDFWNGRNFRVRTLDARFALVIENYFQIIIGQDTEIGRLVTIPKTFYQIQRDLASRKQAFVVVDREASHAYALIGVQGADLKYVDPLSPDNIQFGSREWFNLRLQPDGRGQISTIPVQPRIRVTSRGSIT